MPDTLLTPLISYYALAIFVLIILSAFFSSAETALTAASKPLIHQLAKRGETRAVQLLSMINSQTRVIATLLLGNNAVNVIATSLATALCIQLWNENGVLIASISMTTLLIIFAEILPKSLAAMRPHQWALIISPFVHSLYLVLSPLTFLFAHLLSFLAYPLGLNPRSPHTSQNTDNEDELLGVIDMHGQNPQNREEHVMLRSILELEEITVSDVMTHRSQVDMFDLNEPAADIISFVVNSKRTRIPFYAGSQENIIGVLHVKNLLEHIAQNDTTFMSKKAIVQLSSPPWFIPENTNLKNQLLAFRKRRKHAAIIIDEYSAFVGIVTLEDILEEIVGNIDDELDIPLPGVQRIPDGSCIVDGHVTLRDLSRELDWNIDDGKASTIAGYILHQARVIPKEGQVFAFNGFLFEIIARDHNRIAKIKISPLPKS
jgi:Mg2+/Co2+ transporter CorB